MRRSFVLTFLLIGAVLLGAVLLTRGERRDLTDPRVQLRAARAAAYAPRPIMNRTEFARFAWLEAWARGTPYRVFAQVPYGEFLGTKDEAAFRSVNSKRADLLIVDARGLPAVVIEVQGSGHYQGDARARDAVKRAALASAGVPLVELFPGQDEAETVALIEDALAAR